MFHGRASESSGSACGGSILRGLEPFTVPLSAPRVNDTTAVNNFVFHGPAPALDVLQGRPPGRPALQHAIADT
jgi:hypothetical protein